MLWYLYVLENTTRLQRSNEYLVIFQYNLIKSTNLKQNKTISGISSNGHSSSVCTGEMFIG